VNFRLGSDKLFSRLAGWTKLPLQPSGRDLSEIAGAVT